MIDDPGEVLRTAGVECAEVDEWSIARVWNVFNIGVPQSAEAAILALARLVAEQQRLLQLAYETDFLYIMSFDEWLADLPVDQRRPRDPGDPLHLRWEEHHA